jgi:phospholipid transport system transporter-binding protein
MSTEEAQLPERLTLDEAGQILVQLGAILARQPGPTVSVDAAGLREFDSSAVAVLLELRRQLIAQGKSLRVVRWPRRLQDLVALYGVQELLPA